jgi:hypothetical protein
MSPEQLQCRLDKGMSVADICEIENRRAAALIQRAYEAGRRDAKLFRVAGDYGQTLGEATESLA